MSLHLSVVDTFAIGPFTGNPAAISVVDEFPPGDRMQLIAGEISLLETAFARRRDDGSYDLRWFTPSIEVDLCGHATLAAAHVPGGSAIFHTRSGALDCHRKEDGSIEMDFPSNPAVSEPLPENLDWDLRWFGSARGAVLIELTSATSVREFVPDFSEIAALGSQLVILTASADRSGIDCVSRVFAPNLGIPEDPVTGSAHCVLAPYWADRLARSQLVGEQASVRRGIVSMELHGDRVLIAGQAISISQVTMLV